MLTLYEYDDQGRLVRSLAGSEWTPEDRALMLARQAYLRTLCGKCGHPKETAWHPDNLGWFEVDQVFTCAACTAIANYDNDGTHKPVEYPLVVDTRDYEAKPLPPMPTRRLTPEELTEAMGGAL